MIKIENVSYIYKNTTKKILDNLNFEIYEGEMVALVGKNGSGKSTIGKLISGIIKVKQGNITIDNVDVKKSKNQVGIVFQNPENQIIFNNLYDEFAFCLKNKEKKEILEIINKNLNMVDMSEYVNCDLYNLSLGQKQRIVIAEALASHPKYIILDEPTSMIDSFGKEKIYKIIKNLKNEGYTILCITNNADEILIADRTLILKNGKIEIEIKKEDLVKKSYLLEENEIVLPTILKILTEFNRNGIELNVNNYTIEALINTLKGKIKI